MRIVSTVAGLGVYDEFIHATQRFMASFPGVASWSESHPDGEIPDARSFPKIPFQADEVTP